MRGRVRADGLLPEAASVALLCVIVELYKRACGSKRGLSSRSWWYVQLGFMVIFVILLSFGNEVFLENLFVY